MPCWFVRSGDLFQTRAPFRPGSSATLPEYKVEDSMPLQKPKKPVFLTCYFYYFIKRVEEENFSKFQLHPWQDFQLIYVKFCVAR